MKRHTQIVLYHLLPAVFWLLAIGGTLVPALLALNTSFSTFNYYSGYVVAVMVLIVIAIIGRIKRHTNSVEECLQMSLLFGIASYWLPTVLLLTLPVWGYLIYKNLFSWRSFFATLIGYALVAIWSCLFVWLGWLANPWASFFSIENALGWIPLGAVLIAWLASTIARQILRVR